MGIFTGTAVCRRVHVGGMDTGYGGMAEGGRARRVRKTVPTRRRGGYQVLRAERWIRIEGGLTLRCLKNKNHHPSFLVADAKDCSNSRGTFSLLSSYMFFLETQHSPKEGRSNYCVHSHRIIASPLRSPFSLSLSLSKPAQPITTRRTNQQQTRSDAKVVYTRPGDLASARVLRM